MTIFMNNLPCTWSTTKQSDSFSEKFDRLPQPAICDQQTEQFRPEQNVTILEDEFAYCDLNANPSRIRFFSTRELVTCLFIYVFNNSGERLAIHYNGTLPLDWESLFNKFKNRHEFSAIFVGANSENPNYHLRCQSSLKRAFGSLMHFFDTKKPPFNFKIVQQQVFEFNRIQEKNLPGLIAVYLENKLNEISLAQFQKPYHYPIDTVNPMKNFPSRPEAFVSPQMADMIFLDASHLAKSGLFTCPSDMPTMGSWYFSKQCLALLKGLYKSYSSSVLCDFAVTLETHLFFPLNQPTSQIPAWTERQAMLMNKGIVADETKVTHTCVFDGSYRLNAFTFSPAFIAVCIRNAASIQRHRKLQNNPHNVNIDLVTEFKLDSSGKRDPYILKQNEQRIVQMLEKFIEHQTSLGDACALGDAARVQNLLQMGLIDPNGTDTSQRTPLHYAVMRAPLVKEQLGSNNPHLTVEQCLQGHPAVVRLLLQQKGIVTDLKNSNGMTPYEIAVRDSKEDNANTGPLEKQVAREIVTIFEGA